MTITYPRDFPEADVIATQCRFDYAPLGEASRTAGGAVTFQERMGGSLWELALTTKPLNETNYGIWHSWFLSLRGGSGSRTFKGRDPRRCWPLAYGPAVLTLPKPGGGLFAGDCQVTAVTGETIGLGGLPAGYHVTVGDYVSFDWLGGRALVKALEDATASGGAISSLAVGPWQRTGGTLPTVATVVKAWCLMRPKPGTWSGPRAGVVEPVSFEAIQALV